MGVQCNSVQYGPVLVLKKNGLIQILGTDLRQIQYGLRML